MSDSFTAYRDSPARSKRHTNNGSSILISDSDDEIVHKSDDQVYIPDSSKDSDSERYNETGEQSESDSPLVQNTIRSRLKKYNLIDSDEDPDNSDNSDIGFEPDHDSTKNDLEDDNNSFNDYNSAKRKDVSHNVTKENIKERKLSKELSESISSDNTASGSAESATNVSEESVTNVSEDSITNVSEDSITNVSDDSMSTKSENPVPHSSKRSAPNSFEMSAAEEYEMFVNLAKEEIKVGNIDPLTAQKRALLVCKKQQLEKQLAQSELLLREANIELLPDKGEKLHQIIIAHQTEIQEIEAELESTKLVQPIKDEKSTPRKYISVKQEYNTEHLSCPDISNIPMKPTSSPDSKQLGKQAQETRDRELALTVERLQDLHGSLVARPTEDQKAEDPKGLKVRLMPHQQHALAWLMWRENQQPSGGVLADDMGLGKTLTMISLIMATLNEDESNNDSDDDFHDVKKPLRCKGGTLVVCPASLLAQWESEIKNRCKRGMLTVEIYHGSNRESVPKRLARNDVVITTYNILSREYKSSATVYKIHWKRIILDEAHIIRNHKSQAAEAACGLVAKKRWALTGTPIQNKETDLYSILKFLKCSPFDDLRVWKRWVDNKNAAGHQRLATVMKTLMLRRTKEELQNKGALVSLPEKTIQEVIVKLDQQEQLVYEKVLVYSRTLFAQFLSQKAEKDHMTDLYAGKYDKPSFLSNPNKNTQFTKAQNKLLALHADVKTHEILVLLLRLRQICCHPALIQAMLDQEDMQESGIMDDENLDPNILSKVANITLGDEEAEADEADEIGIDRRVTANLLTSNNPVFEPSRLSSKLRVVFEKVEEILERDDKVIIVSQWTSMLELVADHLSSIKGARFSKFTGLVPIKQRQGIMDSFNSPTGDSNILLLSLTAGGVGLNLVGANHLLLLDIHWNPQLESQAQDRIYRFGQTKPVFIYKFICKDTIEERIQMLQNKKLEIAQNVLSGDRNTAASKLTLNDLKSLFAF